MGANTVGAIENFRVKMLSGHAVSQALPSELERARSALFSLDPDCGREEWVRIAMAAKAAGLSFNDFHEWSARGGKCQGERDCDKVWKSINPEGGRTERTLFALARGRGWKDASHSTALRPQAMQRRPAPRSKGLIASVGRSDSSETAYADMVWQRGKPAPESHQYIVKKHGVNEGLRIYPESAPPLAIQGENMAGWLMVPCWTTDEVLQTIQFISPSGKKLNLPKAHFCEGFFVLGDVKHASRVCLVEGIGQAWAVHRATNDAAVVFFGAARMATVAHVLRRQYPAARLIIVPDRGKEASAAETARAIAGEWCELPNDKKDNYDVNDLLQEGGEAAVRAVLASLQKPPMRFPLIPAAEFVNGSPMEWLVHGILPKQGLAALYGQSGVGKSFLALDLAAAIAAGKEEWFGHWLRQCPVTYVCLEGVEGMKKRMEAWEKRHGTMPDTLSFMPKPINLLSDDNVAELAKAITSSNRNNGVVIIDTLNRAAPNADENSSVDMGRIIAAVSQLQALVGGLVMLVHHAGKKSSAGLRGHSSLHAALDTMIEVEHTATRHSWKVAKCKDGEEGRRYLFRLEPVLVRKDDQGSNVISCTVVAGSMVKSHGESSTSAELPRLPKNPKIAKSILDEMLEKSSETGKAGAPEGRPCVRYDAAVDAVSRQLTSDQRHRKERAKEAIDRLIEKDFYRSMGEWLWCS
jgi:putative DNA primase/helicase